MQSPDHSYREVSEQGAACGEQREADHKRYSDIRDAFDPVRGNGRYSYCFDAVR